MAVRGPNGKKPVRVRIQAFGEGFRWCVRFPAKQVGCREKATVVRARRTGRVSEHRLWWWRGTRFGVTRRAMRGHRRWQRGGRRGCRVPRPQRVQRVRKRRVRHGVGGRAYLLQHSLRPGLGDGVLEDSGLLLLQDAVVHPLGAGAVAKTLQMQSTARIASGMRLVAFLAANPTGPTAVEAPGGCSRLVP